MLIQLDVIDYGYKLREAHGMESNQGRIQLFFRAVYRQARGIVSAVVFGAHHPMRKYSFLILCGYGLAGSLIDLDHFFIAQTNMVRPAHLPVFVVVWIISFSYYTYLNRRVYKSSVIEG